MAEGTLAANVNKRNSSIDIAKGIAALLVVLGHCIQFGNGEVYLQEKLYFDNVVFQAIYSVHMPLFALIGGYLFSGSLRKRGGKSELLMKLRTLGIPILCWGIVNIILDLLMNGMATNIVGLAKRCFWVLLSTHWFLWAMLMCSISVIIVHDVFKDFIPVYLMLFILNLITSDVYNLQYFKFLYPFFTIGYLWKNNGIRVAFVTRILHSKIRWSVLFVTWLFLLEFFSKDTFIYQSGFTLLRKKSVVTQLGIDLYRILIGIVGSAWILALSMKISKKRTINVLFIKLGEQSLGIYIVNSHINLYVLNVVCKGFEPSVGHSMMLAILVTGVCWGGSVLIGKSRMLSKLLLGGR